MILFTQLGIMVRLSPRHPGRPGFAVTIIVRNGHMKLTVHCGEPHGEAIRENYVFMTLKASARTGKPNRE